MAPGWNPPPSQSQPDTPSLLDGFTPHPSIGPFHGAGRRRAADRSAAAQERREQAARLAERLVEGGLEPDDVYLSPEEVEDAMLALDGSDLRDCLGRPRRAWIGYPDHAHCLKTKVGREYALFADANGIDRVTQVVIRPPESTFDLKQLAARHARDSATLGEMLRYARKTRAPDLAWDLVSAEIENVGRCGWDVDSHFHLTVRAAGDDDLLRVAAYFEARGWTFWFSSEKDLSTVLHPVALVQYAGKGLADALLGSDNEWRPDALAELRRQTRGLAMVRATGAFRKWKSQIGKEGLVVVEDRDGKPMMAPRRVVGDRLRRKLRETCSFIALRLCVHDFGDGLFRRAIRVRGTGHVTVADVAAVYDLSHSDLTSSKVNTAIQESIAPPPSQPPWSALPDPGGGPPPSAIGYDDVPW